MPGIAYLLEESREKELYESYSAQLLWMIARGLYGIAGAEYDMPQYVEILHPETRKSQPTAQQIKDHVLQRLLEA